MGREIEIKVPLTDAQYSRVFDFMMGKTEVKDISLSKVCDGKLVLKQDEYYSKFPTEQERRATGEPQVIRLRTDVTPDKSEAYFTIKTKTRQNGIELNKEDETFVAEPEVIREFMKVSGFICWFKKEKKAYGVHCNYSDLPGVDFHLELETVNNLKYIEVEVTQEEGDADKIKAALNGFVSCFGIDSEKRDIRSWVEIINSNNA